jgi:hypothetical protein
VSPRLPYFVRLPSKSFWRKVFSGRIDFRDAANSLTNTVATAVRGKLVTTDFRQRMFEGLEQFDGAVLFILSGQDLTAREFVAHASAAVAVYVSPRPSPGSYVTMNAVSVSFAHFGAVASV